MVYKLCKENLIRCDFDCRRCANLVHDAMTEANQDLRTRLDKLNKEKEGFLNEIKRITEERNKIHDELKEIKEDNSKLQLDLDIANARLHTERVSYDYLSSLYKELEEKCAKLEKENNYLDQECEALLAEFSERIAELEKENLFLKRSGNIATIEKKLQALTEDIIRLDKCLSRRPCVKMEREEED